MGFPGWSGRAILKWVEGHDGIVGITGLNDTRTHGLEDSMSDGRQREQ